MHYLMLRASAPPREIVEAQRMSNSPLSQILEKYRQNSFSERDKGSRFEALIRRYLKTDPLYAHRFKHVWLWNEFPFRSDFGGKDTGIDLVAETREGEYWAIQCKCYAEDAYLGKDAVDSFLATSSKCFQNEALKTVGFAARLWVSTTRNFGPEFENTIRNQNPPVLKLSLTDLENSSVDWFALEKGASGVRSRKAAKDLRPHQRDAVAAVHKYFKTPEHSRGKLIMACGTGKTFTALKIAEKETCGNGLVLCLVPSIALVGQMLREWSADASGEMNAVCVCSDVEVSKKKSKDADELFESVEDLALPASTDEKSVAMQILKYAGTSLSERKGLTVVFSTYHSIEVISKAQKRLFRDYGEDNFTFDLIVCDEAHRTTGVTLKNDTESAFVRVHDNGFLPAKKRLYMTATPRLYGDESKKKAKESDAVLCSMDDPALYGDEIFRIGFGEAVEKGLLADYKVLVLTIGEDQISPSLQRAIADGGTEINTDDAAKFIGCLNALSKRMLVNHELLAKSDPEPMRRAVAFCQNIKISKKTAGVFGESQKLYEADFDETTRKNLVCVEAEHVDGSMGAGTRDAKLAWLKEDMSSLSSRKKCRILTNVRCLSEGVDVPALDAVLFLSARNSQIDVVQSVGRVMRTAPGKKYGYIIIPVVIPADIKPEDALNQNERFAVVWSVLNALRAHDDRFNAIVNKIALNKNKPKQVLVGGIATGEDCTRNSEFGEVTQGLLNLQFEKLSGEIYVKMVEKVGDRRYWENWAKDVAEIATRHIARIRKLVSVAGTHKTAFDEFVRELRQNINPSVREDDVIEMLAQHIITKPVFDALFQNHEFTQSNAISRSMSEMLKLLEEQSLDKDHETLERFYNSVRKRVSDIDNAEGKQKIIVELYDKFFKTAFPKVVEKLGIVYTPVEIVDFLIHSVEHVLKTEFSRSLADPNVHILDPFTGTGTFITRLLQSGIIPKEKLLHKYRNEIHANEIVLLAYYIASVNIENAFAELSGTHRYEPFPGACLTDTFQLTESDDASDFLGKMFPENSKRVRDQRKVPLRVILGNPPYSVGQKSANDNAQNERYPKLEARIAETYAAGTKATSAKALYNSYVKAFRWASDRIDPKNGGIVAFVTDGAWLDGNAMDGFRKCLEKEFSLIYVFNLRGNQRTSGELSRREGGKVFGSGSRTPISLTILVKSGEAVSNRFNEESGDGDSAKRLKTASPKARIHYRDIGDYLSRETKLEIVKKAHDISFADGNAWEILSPNEHGDWINLRNDKFSTYIPLAPEKKFDTEAKSVFITAAIAPVSNRDVWVYNFSQKQLCENMCKTIDFYNQERKRFHESGCGGEVKNFIEYADDKINWTRGTRNDLTRNIVHQFNENEICSAMYRPFCKQNLYFSKSFIECIGLAPKLFPTRKHENLVICVQDKGKSELSPLITNCIPDLHLNGDVQAFPLYYYEKNDLRERSLFDDVSDEYVRRDGVSDFILERARELYGERVTKEDIFYYVYGFLHSPDYRREFSADLKKMLPRLPLVDLPKDFWAFSKAGRELAELHLNYETAPLPRDVVATHYGSESPSYRVSQMRFEKGLKAKDRPDKILYNEQITVGPVPAEAYDYVVNGKSVIEWIMERYAVTTHKESGIVNDPNLWCDEHNDPAYIVNLLRRVIDLSRKIVAIVNTLPRLAF